MFVKRSLAFMLVAVGAVACATTAEEEWNAVSLGHAQQAVTCGYSVPVAGTKVDFNQSGTCETTSISDTFALSLSNDSGSWVASTSGGSFSLTESNGVLEGSSTNNAITGCPSGVLLGTLRVRVDAGSTYAWRKCNFQGGAGCQRATTLEGTTANSCIPLPPSVSVDTNPHTVGSPVTVAFARSNPTTRDWVSLSRAGSANTSFASWSYTSGQASGSRSLATTETGNFVARLYDNDGFTVLAQSPAFTVSPNGAASIGTGASSYTQAQQVVVNLSNMLGNARDWVAIAPQGSPVTTLDRWAYTGGATSGQLSFAAAGLSGTYVARAYFADSYTVEATSAPFTVTSGSPIVSTDASSYSSSTPVVVSFSNMSGAATDWVSIAPAGSPLTTFDRWQYTNGVRQGTASFNVSTLPAGSYVARAYFNNSFALEAESPTFQVGSICPSGNPNLQTDPNNCGSCGHSCQGSTCSAGLCAPTTLGTPYSSPENKAIADIEVNASNVYFLSPFVGRISVNGGDPFLANNVENSSGLAISASNVYWTSQIMGSTWSMSSCGLTSTCPSPTRFGTTASTHRFRMAVVGDTLLWKDNLNNNTNRLLRCSISNGCATQSILDSRSASPNFNEYVVANSDWVFWSVLGSGPYQCKHSDNCSSKAQLGSASFTDVALDSGNVYWLAGQSVIKCPIGANGCTSSQALTTSTGTPQRLTTDGVNVYWTESDNVIKRCSVNGCNNTPSTVATSASGSPIRALRVNGDWLYYTSGGYIMKVAK